MITIDPTVLATIIKHRDEIAHHNQRHFIDNASDISDEEFDALIVRYNLLLEKHPREARQAEKDLAIIPLSGTGTALTVESLKENMLSLNKVFNEDDVSVFYKQQPVGATFNYEYKLDGLALELNYVLGVLAEILTRYDGANGELVTHALPLFSNIPVLVPEWKDVPNRRVRGEGYITYENFDKYNAVAVTPAKNPRNSVAGWVRALPQNQNPLVKGLLSYNVYWCSDALEQDSYDDQMEALVKLGFDRAPKINDLYVKNNIRSTELPVDGVVIKVNELAFQKEMGNRSSSPRWAVAYKFPAEKVQSSVTDVIWQVGRTGNVTPVVIYSPVMLMGVECTRASLHNYRMFANHGLRIGSRVIISRNGDVIPQIQSVVEAGKGKLIKAPKNCPSCNSLLSYDGENNEEIYLRCDNTSGCPAQLVQRCYNVVDKDGFDIDGIGLTTLTKWVSEGLVKCPSDIFMIPESVVNEKLYKRIHLAKNIQMNKFIKALSLPSVGKTTALSIAQFIGDGDIMAFLQDPAKLQMVPDIGPGTALQIAVMANLPTFQSFAFKLLNQASIILPPDPLSSADIVCKVSVSGGLSVPRTELTELFKSHGIEISNKVSKGYKYFIAGKDPSQAKINKAKKLNIPVIDASSITDLHSLIQEVLS